MLSSFSNFGRDSRPLRTINVHGAGTLFLGINDEGVKAPRAKPQGGKKELTVPDYFTAVLKKNKKAQATFDNFSPSHKREYVEWLEEAKRDETRKKRLETAIEWMASGKSRNWKYAAC